MTLDTTVLVARLFLNPFTNEWELDGDVASPTFSPFEKNTAIKLVTKEWAKFIANTILGTYEDNANIF